MRDILNYEVFCLEQQKLIEDLKFQQSQIAFKEQIALLEQIKAKQVELETMQKNQYKQEKELLRRKAEIMRIQHSTRSKNTSGKEAAIEDGSDPQGLDESPNNLDTEQADQRENRPEMDNKNTDLNITPTNRTTSSARRPSTAMVTTPTTATSQKTDRKIDQFVKNMEERAMMREQLKREREEKRKKQEQEKLELMKGLILLLV